MQAANLQMCVQDFVYLMIKAEEFTKDQVKEMSDLKTAYEDSSKTPSQRIRNVIYRLWQQNNEGYADFNLYYQFRVEGIINHFKSQLI